MTSSDINDFHAASDITEADTRFDDNDRAADARWRERLLSRCSTPWTDGPWTALPHEKRRNCVTIRNRDDEYIASYVEPRDAGVIALAPELADAVLAAARDHRNGNAVCWNEHSQPCMVCSVAAKLLALEGNDA